MKSLVRLCTLLYRDILETYRHKLIIFQFYQIADTRIHPPNFFQSDEAKWNIFKNSQ